MNETCFRCKTVRTDSHWSKGASFLYGDIKLGFHSQLFLHIIGNYDKHFCATVEDFNEWREYEKLPFIEN